MSEKQDFSPAEFEVMKVSGVLKCLRRAPLIIKEQS